MARDWRGRLIVPSAPRSTDGRVAIGRGHRAVDEVHLGRADEAGDEEVVGLVVELERRADLRDGAGIEHDDLVGHGHGLDLVVGDVDHGRAEPLVQLHQLDAHLGAQRGVEVGQRLVEQENLGLAHDGAADGDALALAAGERAGALLQARLELQHAWRQRRRAVLTSALGSRSTRSGKAMFSNTVMCG